MAASAAIVAHLTERLDLPALKKMAAEQQYHNFIETFLTNKLCLKL